MLLLSICSWDQKKLFSDIGEIQAYPWPFFWGGDLHTVEANRNLKLFLMLFAVFSGATTQQETWSASTPLCLRPLSPPPPLLDNRVSADGPAPSATLRPPPRQRTPLFAHWHAARRSRPQRSRPNSCVTSLSALTHHIKASKRRTREAGEIMSWTLLCVHRHYQSKVWAHPLTHCFFFIFTFFYIVQINC